jgi:hypothetical protein
MLTEDTLKEVMLNLNIDDIQHLCNSNSHLHHLCLKLDNQIISFGMIKS